jgi:hypothetical protein
MGATTKLKQAVAATADIAASSGNVAAAVAAATLAGVAGKTTYITGFVLTGAGATAASVVLLAVTGTSGGTMTFAVAVPAGVTAALAPLVVVFSKPIPASAVNTAIVVSCPSLGAGNTNAAVVATGFQL